MKLLLVFVSALVLVHGNVSPSESKDSVFEIKPEAVAEYAGQEVGGEAPQALVAEEAPRVPVFSAEEENDSVYEIKPEEAAGYAGQEAGNEAPQALVAEEAPGVRVFAAEEENDSVYEIEPEAVAGYGAQEADGEAPHALVAEEAPGVRVIGAEEQNDSVYEMKPEGLADNGAPQALAAEEAPGVFGAEQGPQAYKTAQPLSEEVPAPESGVYIPSVTRVCTIYACQSICWRLGYLYGQCISLNNCWCHN